MAYTQFDLVAETSEFHVSNVQIYSYLHDARLVWHHYCDSLNVSAVVVNADVNFKKEIFHNDKLMIKTWLERIGNTSITLKQTIIDTKEELCASAEVVLTMIDNETRQKVAVPDQIRNLQQNDNQLEWETNR